jgi:hypothetical protein
MKITIILILIDTARHDEGPNWFGMKPKYSYAPTTLTTLAALVPPEIGARLIRNQENQAAKLSCFFCDIFCS